MNLKNKRFVVTGSTTGIGRGIAENLLSRGARVVINSHLPLSDEDQADLAALGDFEFIQADLYRPEEAIRLIEESAAKLGGLDGLVNNAGTYIRVSYLNSTPADTQRLFALNFHAGYFASQTFAKIVGQRKFDAAIVNIGSTNSLQAERDSVMYDASKGAILMMTRALALTLADQGIRVNGVGPGLIQTPLNNCAHADNPPLLELLHKQIPMRRTGLPSDVAGAVAFLLSPDAEYITGQMLYVDGGIIAQQMTYEV